jgi:hypothetical protein
MCFAGIGGAQYGFDVGGRHCGEKRPYKWLFWLSNFETGRCVKTAVNLRLVQNENEHGSNRGYVLILISFSTLYGGCDGDGIQFSSNFIKNGLDIPKKRSPCLPNGKNTAILKFYCTNLNF